MDPGELDSLAEHLPECFGEVLAGRVDHFLHRRGKASSYELQKHDLICLQGLEELASVSHDQDFLTPQHQ